MKNEYIWIQMMMKKLRYMLLFLLMTGGLNACAMAQKTDIAVSVLSEEVQEAEKETETEIVSEAGTEAKTETEGAISTETDAEDNEEEELVSPIRISEILPANTSVKHKNKYCDMVEVMNVSEETIQLSDYSLSDSKKHLTDNILPEEELAPGEVKVFYCIGKNKIPKTNDELAISLSYEGEKLYLADANGTIYDKVKYNKMPANVSYGLSSDLQSYQYYEKPSFGEVNGDGCVGISIMPSISVEPGLYEEAVTFYFLGDGDIYYTTDGSKPTTSSKHYDGGEITVKKTGAIRAIRVQENHVTSFPETFAFFIGEPEYELDMLMVSISDTNFETMNTHPHGSKYYNASVSLFSGGVEQFSKDAGIRVSGGMSRNYDKKSYKIKFSKNFGDATLNYRLFDEYDMDSFDSFVIRGGSQDNESAMLRDEFVTSLSRKNHVVTEVLSQAYRPVNLYINGNYWGLYYIREHIDQEMIASHYNCKPEDVSLIKQNVVEAGDEEEEWKSIWQYVKEHDLSETEHYEYIKERVSLESVADYYILEIWSGNEDSDNVRVFKAGDDKWRYFLFDLDLSLLGKGKGTASYYLKTYNTGAYTYNALIYKLLKNEEFVSLWNERVDVLTDSILADDYATAYVDEIYAMLEHDMQYNCKRWGGHEDPSQDVSYQTYNGWKSSVEHLKKNLSGRAEMIKEQLKK